MSSKINKKVLFGFLATIFLVVLLGIFFALFNFTDLKTKDTQTKKSETENVIFSDITKDSPKDSSTEINKIGLKNEIFIAISNLDKDKNTFSIKINIIDAVNGKVVLSKNIYHDWSIMPSGFNSANSNNSVQYNSITKDIYIATSGRSDMGGECINNDGTCFFRIYKINLEEESPRKIFESDDVVTNWLINDTDDSLVLSLSGEGVQSFRKINAQTGDVIFDKELNLSSGEYLADLILSNDKKYTYQLEVESFDEKGLNDNLKLIKFNNANGDFEEYQIYNGNTQRDVYLSPNNKYLAFYANKENDLYLYEFQNQKLLKTDYAGEVSNVTLLWSGDSSKIMQMLDGSLSYYDVTSFKNYLIKDSSEVASGYIYSWAPVNEYLVFNSQNTGLRLFDIERNESVQIQSDKNVSVYGLSWY